MSYSIHWVTTIKTVLSLGGPDGVSSNYSTMAPGIGPAALSMILKCLVSGPTRIKT